LLLSHSMLISIFKHIVFNHGNIENILTQSIVYLRYQIYSRVYTLATVLGDAGWQQTVDLLW